MTTESQDLSLTSYPKDQTDSYSSAVDGFNGGGEELFQQLLW